MTTQRENASELIWESSAGPGAEAGWRLSRPAAGALVGVLLGLVYTLVAAVIDSVLMPDVPLGVDWPALWGKLALAGLGGAALGVLTAWPEAGWQGVVAGAAAFVAWSFGQSYLQLRAASLILLPLFVPLVMMSLPVTLFLRWGANRQAAVLSEGGWARWRGQLWLVMVVLAVGGFAGSWSQMPAASQEAVRRVHRLLGRTFAEAAGAPLPAAFQAVPEVRAHADSPYTLGQEPVPNTAQVDVRIAFADGYRMRCLVDGNGGPMVCRPGDQPIFGGELINPADQR
ncbi:MAG: hypothetical protein JNK29_16270 [Anaerolineales bacterium]|nr:hypothetical protein [Anaerolineales bacterium]